jgi:2-iminoacetate synthase ThiH
MAKLTNKQKVDIITAYQNLTPMIELALKYGITRQAVYKTIKAAGIDTCKNGGIDVSCSCCQKVIKKPKCRSTSWQWFWPVC